MQERVAAFDIEDFYFLARTALVKDERHLDRFDRVVRALFQWYRDAIRPAGRDPRGLAQKARRTISDRGRKEADPIPRRLGRADGDLAPAPCRAEGRGTRAAANGLAPPAPRRLAPMGTTPKASALASRKGETAARSRSGTAASSAISTTPIELGTRNIKLALAPAAAIRPRRRRRRARPRRHGKIDRHTTPAGSI